MRERHNRNYPIPESIRLQNAFWAWERATWIVLAVILLIALTGLLAHGPLSKSTVMDGGLSLTYERFQRVTALARFNARILVSYGDEASLTLSPPFADNFQIADMEPRPLRSSRTARPGIRVSGADHGRTLGRAAGPPALVRTLRSDRGRRSRRTRCILNPCLPVRAPWTASSSHSWSISSSGS